MTCSEAGRLGGRPTLLTEELQQAVCSLIEETACTVYTACLSLGIPWRTVYFWEQWGREGRQPYERFAQAVMQARARCELGLVREFKQHDQNSQRSTQYYPFILERRFAGDYGNRGKVEDEVRQLPDTDLQTELEAVRSRVALDSGAGGRAPEIIEGEFTER